MNRVFTGAVGLRRARNDLDLVVVIGEVFWGCAAPEQGLSSPCAAPTQAIQVLRRG